MSIGRAVEVRSSPRRLKITKSIFINHGLAAPCPNLLQLLHSQNSTTSYAIFLVCIHAAKNLISYKTCSTECPLCLLIANKLILLYSSGYPNPKRLCWIPIKSLSQNTFDFQTFHIKYHCVLHSFLLLSFKNSWIFRI